ncbi:MAG: hypothetical protein ACKVQA_01605 [Burkholderiales bacterium]
MAMVTITPEAAELARSQLANPHFGEGSLRVLAIRWSRGIKEVRRGPNGDVIWETIEAPAWIVEVIAWDKPKATAVLADTIMIDGIRVLLDRKASTLAHGLVVTVQEGKLALALHGA